MVLAISYSQVERAEDEQSSEPFGKGDIYDLLECPVCGKITLRKYFWHDYMETEADVSYEIVFPVRQTYTARREQYFPLNSPHDAYVEIRKIIQRAQKSLQIIDPYVDVTLFKLLSTVNAKLDVAVLTSKCGPGDFTLEASKFKSQYPSITFAVRTTREFHDRFLVVDERECFHLGASIKDAGRQDFMIHSVEDADNIQALLLRQKAAWAKATILVS
jgi:hypothetical protein